jgi:hypothetical protein
MNAIEASKPKPLYYEAREYCERFDLGPEECERVRQSMAYREFMERMQPWHSMLARHLSHFPFVPGGELPEPVLHMKAEVDKIARHEAESLGLSYTSP